MTERVAGDGRFRVERLGDVDAFVARAGELLAAREAEHCLILGIADSLRMGALSPPEPPLFAVVAEADDRRVRAAALRTAPHNLVVSMVDDVDAVDALATALAGEALPGVSGPTDAAARFAEAWTTATGRRARRTMAERIFRLSMVREPRPAPGRMRLAEPADRDLLLAWLEAFTLEALGVVEPAAEGVDRWMAGGAGAKALYLWQDGDVPVSLCGAGGRTPHGIRIGPVYTPPAQRGRGYASNLVAHASQAQLDAGRRFVFLFTDLANPTSNKIYQDIGYEPVADWDMFAFIG
jgi:uncharacterized protein